MGQFQVTVCGEEFTLASKDGEEARLAGLARRVDDKASLLKERLGEVGQRRLLLMAAMLLTDELEEAITERDAARAQAKAGVASAAAPTGGISEDDVNQFINAVCDELDEVAKRLASA